MYNIPLGKMIERRQPGKKVLILVNGKWVEVCCTPVGYAI